MSVLSPPSDVTEDHIRESNEGRREIERAETSSSVRRSRLFQRVLHAGLRRINGGCITVIDGETRTRFGDPTAELHAVIRINDVRCYRVIAVGGEIAAAEAFRDGLWSCDDLVALIQIFARNLQASESLGGRWKWLCALGRKLIHRLNRNTRSGSRRNIAAHYDLSNEFYSLFLDETMTYSSGVFSGSDHSMEEASIEKYDRLCRKLLLTPQDELLEIGSGWGGFTEHAVKNYGCRVTTTTISKEQHDYAKQRFENAGIASRVRLLLADYRDLQGHYDKLVSIEMIEAVGHEYFDTFFAKCSGLLKSDGLMAIQAITIPDQRYDQYRRSVDFIQRHIFPGGCLPSFGAMIGSIGRVTDLQLTHSEDFAEHYAMTLSHWRRRFYTNRDAIRDLDMSDSFLRLWDYYLCYCEGAFREKQIGVSQLVFQKPNNRRTPVFQG